MWRASAPLSRAAVAVRFDRKFNRADHPTHDEARIARLWTTKRATNPRLYDAPKFRLADATSRDVDGLDLDVGMTSYRDFQCTNYADADRVAELKRDGLRRHGNAQSYLSDALGVSALLLTDGDDRLVVQQRSRFVGEGVGLWDTPGGHAEPKDVVGWNDDIDPFENEAFSSDVIVREIFDSIVREVEEEVNVGRSKLADPLLGGIARQEMSAGRPAALFLIRTVGGLCRRDVEALYAEGGEDKYESTDIRFIAVEDVVAGKVGASEDFSSPLNAALALLSKIDTY